MKPYSLLHSNGQFLIEQLVAAVGWQVNAVETGGQNVVDKIIQTMSCRHNRVNIPGVCLW